MGEGETAGLSGPRPRGLGRAPRIQVALLLDTSNSMDGLIDQARSQLWRVVNTFAHARRGDRGARLEVALYEYGNNDLTASSGYVRRVLPFTTDLDRVSEELFALDTNGGDEFCGTVIQTALDELGWTQDRDDMKVVFIAGNEPFTQGPVDFRPVCRRAAGRGIVVNTIHCGAHADGEAGGWRTGAQLAAGTYSIIDHNKVAVHIDAPQDAEIARLGALVNQTYVPYGAHGREGVARQEAQDRNAARSGMGSVTSRSMTKSNQQYYNSHWDLVDAVKDGSVDPSTLKPADLPDDLKGVAPAKRKEAVLAKAKERERIQSEIQKLAAARETFVAEARRKQGKASGDTLDAVMSEALREQAACRGIALQ